MKLKRSLINSQLESLIELLEQSFKKNHNQLTDQFLVFCRVLNVGDINADNIQGKNVEAFLQVMYLIQSTNTHPLHAKFDSLITMLPTFVQHAYQAYKTAKNKSTNATNIDLLITKLQTLSQFIEDENLAVFLAFCYGLKTGTLSNSEEHVENIGIAFHALFTLETKLNQEQSELTNIINECKALLPSWIRESYQKIVGKVADTIMDDWQMIPSATAPTPAPKHIYPYKILDNSISVTGQFDNNAIVRFFSLCETEKLEPQLTRRTDGFTLSNTAENSALYEQLLIRFLAPTLTLVAPATTSLRFSTNSVALREAQPASIDKDDLKSRNPFTGKSIFIPGEINDAMMVVFEAECFNFGLNPEYRLVHDGCFIQDGNNDEQNLTHYVLIMKNIMLDKSDNSSMAMV